MINALHSIIRHIGDLYAWLKSAARTSIHTLSVKDNEGIWHFLSYNDSVLLSVLASEFYFHDDNPGYPYLQWRVTL